MLKIPSHDMQTVIKGVLIHILCARQPLFFMEIWWELGVMGINKRLLDDMLTHLHWCELNAPSKNTTKMWSCFQLFYDWFCSIHIAAIICKSRNLNRIWSPGETYLRPATVEGNVFTSVCQEFCPQGATHAPEHAHTLDTHPPAEDTTRCGQWGGGTHPTGMHSCLN